MKEYRLKKWYPSLPQNWKQKGDIIVVQRQYGFKLHPSIEDGLTDETIRFTEVTDNEFWEELKPKSKSEYEITKIKLRKNGYTYTPRNLYAWTCGLQGCDIALSHYEGQYDILSVKRLSDGEVFTVGDSIGNTETSRLFDRVIKEFTVGDEYFVKTSTGRSKLNDIEHRKKEPRLTTEDGVELYEGDSYWFIWLKDVTASVNNKPFTPYLIENLEKQDEDSTWSKDAKFFSTKEAAKDYIIRNAAVLNAHEIYEVLKPYITSMVDVAAFDKLKQKTKEKLRL